MKQEVSHRNKFRVMASLLISLTTCAVVLDACKKKEQVSVNYNPTYLQLAVPAGWPQPATNIFKNNPLTEEGFQLGRKLFYDGRLSKDGKYPCASCHQQVASFATYDHQLSHGYNDGHTYRNAPGLHNLAWMKELNWDGGSSDLETQPIAHITNANEMAETVDNVLKKLSIDSSYKRLFTAAFGDANFTGQRMLRALAQFTGSILAFNSKYDQVKRGEARFTQPEQEGYNTFKTKCNACHAEPLFTDNSYRNTGLTQDPVLKDSGRMRVTGLAADMYKFRVPGLRNVALTFPYLHDGRLVSLLQVVEHYRSGIQTSQPTLNALLKARIILTNEEKVNLVEFLQTLTDNALVNDARFAQPR